jgi:hypothetical protein
MLEAYYSQRVRKAREAPDLQIGNHFVLAFLEYIDRLTRMDCLCEHFGADVCDGFPGGRDDTMIAARITEDLGYGAWPVPPQTATTEQMLDLAEFFFQYVSAPTTTWFHDFCQSSHPTGTYDAKKARYDYTVNVNAIFSRFNHPYKLVNGHIIHLSSAVLDTRVFTHDFNSDDQHLLGLLNKSIEFLGERSGKRKLDALRCIVDAFERLKTLEGTDKKKSIETVLTRISPNAEIQTLMNQHFRNLTDIANRSTIRHHERDRAILTDNEFVDYLYYTYYNACRLIIGKYTTAKLD